MSKEKFELGSLPSIESNSPQFAVQVTKAPEYFWEEQMEKNLKK